MAFRSRCLVFCFALLSTTAVVRAADATSVKSPLEPTEALKAFALPAGLRIELVAAEPEVIDPVALRFDEDGRLWVVEMRDYPNPPAEGEKPRSRIRLLEDRDGDGRYETSHIFADELLFATGLQPWRGGVFVTISGKIVYMKDTDGDNRADVSETWFTGFTAENPQLRVNHPRFALDNYIYVASGMRGGMVESIKAPTPEPISLRSRDLRFDPRTGRAESVTGTGQFGVTFDDYGNRFVVSNRNPCVHLVLADQYVRRNPLLALPSLQNDVAASGENSHVFPIGQQWTTSVLHAGQFTAACGVDLYRGDALPPDYYGNSFTCEPTGNLVHRETIVPAGASFAGTPAYPDRDFLASPDTWFRPVNIGDGFDGALYVMDMYRAVIEHPQFMPAELKERPDLWLGNDRGRIYRIVPGDWKRPNERPQLSKATSVELVKLLEHPSAWWRETASRLLNERQDQDASAALVEMARSGATPQARVGALWVLRGLDTLDRELINAKLLDINPRVREQAVVLSEPLIDSDDAIRKRVSGLGMTEAAGEKPDERLRFQVALSLGGNADPLTTEVLARIAVQGVDDVWTRRAVLTATPDHAAPVLEKVLSIGRRNRSENQLALIEELARIVGARRDAGEIAELLKLPLEGPVGVTLVNGLAGGMRSTVRLSMFVQTASKEHPELADYVNSWFEQAAAIAGNADQEMAARSEACDLLGQAAYDMAAPVLLAIVDRDKSNDLRRRALNAFSSQREERVGPALIERLAVQTPTMRSAIFDALLMNAERLSLLLDEIEAGRVKAGELGTLRANRVVQYRDPKIQERAKKLLASAIPADRAKALADYQDVIALKGDPRHGKEVFRKNCSTCHKLGDVGADVGPSIAWLPNKTPEQMLVDILQPSKAIDNNFMSYSLVTTDGNAYTGIIASETASSVTLKLPEGKILSLLRTDIEELRSNGISLMPEGLERNVSKQQMADVISFVKNWRYLDSGVPASTVTGN